MRQWCVETALGLGLLLACALVGCTAAPHRAAVSTAAEFMPSPPTEPLVPPASLPARGEELWIIEKPAAALPANPATADEPPHAAGILMSARGVKLAPLPLIHSDVRADVTGCIACVDVRQQFSNRSNEPAEASYSIRLPLNAAVSEFIMTIGRRRIRGIVRERAEAEQIYRDAQGQGLLASLMVQQSPDVFVQRVANLEPGQQIDVEVQYFHTLACNEGWFEFAFPLAIAPGTPSTPAERSGRDVSVSVHLNPGVSIERVESPSHQIAVQLTGSTVADASLVQADRIANRDFVIRYKVAGDAVKSSLGIERDGDGGVFSLLLVAPAGAEKLPRAALEVVIAIDPAAGLAGNVPAAALLRSLSPQDAFRIVRAVPGSAQSLTNESIPATPKNVERYVDALSTLRSMGSPGVDVFRTALTQSDDGARRRVVCLVTDGRENAAEALAVIPDDLGSTRIVVIGVGPAPQREVIDAIAHRGRGAAVYLPPGQDPSSLLADLIANLSHPAITDIELDWRGAQVSDIFPRAMPDLWCGRTVWVTGRYHGSPPASLILHGKRGAQATTWTVVTTGSPVSVGRSPMACVWARRKISDLISEAVCHPNSSVAEQVRQIALEYGLLSRYTAFGTVDAMSGMHPETVERAQ